jgi:hypothetical protein
MRLPICVFLLAIASCSLAKAAGHSACDLYPTQTGWHVFVDYQDRFCFEYPPQYRAAPAVFAPGVSTGSGRFVGRLTTKPSPAVVPSASDDEAASILIFAYGSPFRPKDLTKFAPTGLEETPPQPIHAPHGEFYYYGAGGGGVDYPDSFYFGLRGRLFSIEFLGPYSGDKTPAPETKRIEPKVLASFRSF